ncbi:MAG: LicD family protein [Dethiobacteraceae bacterium]|jgi:lipopolysaccharide cholinephosphotransferase
MGKKLSLREIQQTELEILKYFAKFCEKNSIRYYLSGGTLLGAIRHGGFIPWDDDIDVIMPRPDYNKFLVLCKNAIEKNEFNPNYRLSVNEFDPIARIMDMRTTVKMKAYSNRKNIGLWIDIFPMDGVPSNPFILRIHYLIIRFLRDCLYFLSTTPNIKRRNKIVTLLQYIAIPFRPLLRIIGEKRIAICINKIASIYDFESSSLCAAIASGYGLQEVNKRSEFVVQKKVDFEGSSFFTTAAYHSYLSKLYGDYLQLPPENERNKHHMEAWWI